MSQIAFIFLKLYDRLWIKIKFHIFIKLDKTFTMHDLKEENSINSQKKKLSLSIV